MKPPKIRKLIDWYVSEPYIYVFFTKSIDIHLESFMRPIHRHFKFDLFSVEDYVYEKSILPMYDYDGWNKETIQEALSGDRAFNFWLYNVMDEDFIEEYLHHVLSNGAEGDIIDFD